MIDGGKGLQNLKSEIEILRELSYPTIIQLFEIYEEPDSVYLVTEYVKGGELFERINNNGNYSETDALQFFTNLVKTIIYLHKNNIIHRDLKPENILLLYSITIIIGLPIII